jgi:hypothetical protein
MDTTYIVLDGSNADLSTDGTRLSWNLNDEFFKKFESENVFNIQLHSIQFNGDAVALPTIYCKSSEVYANMRIFNMSSTIGNGEYSLMGLVDSNIDTVNNTVSSSVSSSQIFPKYITNKFNNIGIYIIHNQNLLKFTEDIDSGLTKDTCIFVFKLTKLKV